MTVQLGSVVKRVNTVEPRKLFPDSEFTYVDISSIDQNTKVVTSPKSLPAIDAPSRARQLLEAGDILVSTVRPNLNAVAVVPQQLEDSIGSTGFCVLRPDQTKADSAYLFHWVKSKVFIDDMVRKATGASYPAVSDRIILESAVPLPTLDEQRRIAAMLDKVEELRAKRRTAIALTDQLPNAIFFEMFGEPGATQQNWPALRLGDFCKTGSGGTPSRQSESRYYEGGTIPWVKSGELRESVIYQTEEHITPDALNESSAKLVPKNAILLAMYGATVGRLAILGIPAATNQAVCNIIPDPGRANLVFVFHALQQQVSAMISMAVGGAQPNISQNLIRNLPICLPPLKLQQQFATQVAAIHQTKALHQSAYARASVLSGSLQAEVFGGSREG